MSNRSITQRLTRGLVITALLGYGMAAMAQAEPTLNQVYEAAQAGHLEQAQVMMQQVLVAHPGSAKAHFVQAELLARQGQMSRAREALATAEKLAPGLPFAKPASVQSLRTQLTTKPAAPATTSPALQAMAVPMAAPAPSSPFPWGLALLLGGAAIGLGIYMLRKKSTDTQGTAPVFSSAQQPAYAPQGGGLGGPQSFGMGNPGAPAQPYGQPAYGQQPYGQPVGSGLGGRVMGGLATGLAVGAGVMAAQAIGKSLMGNNEHPQPHQLDNAANNDYVPLNSNNDLGGQNFGINDTSSWDDGNAIASSGDGGDWDS